MAAEIFDNDFYSYMDKIYKEFNEDLKSYSKLTVFIRQIRLGPRHKTMGNS